MLNTPWPSDRVERLRSLAGTGLSMGEIAREMKLTRNAVIGKLARLGLSTSRTGYLTEAQKAERLATKRRIDAEAKRIKRAAAKPTGRIYLAGNGTVRPVYEIEGQQELRDAEVAPLHIALVDLTPTSCRYPYGEGPFTFCGRLKSDGSYCFAHAALCAGTSRGPYNKQKTGTLAASGWL